MAIDLEHLGRALRDAGQPDQAIAMYQESHQVGMTPAPVQNWNPGVSLRHQAILLAERGEVAEALRLCHDIVEIARARQNRHELTIALEYLGDALWKCGHLEDAAVAFAESFQCGMHPDRLPDWNPRIPTRKEADVRLELGDRAAADELRRRAVESLRTDVEHYRALGDRKNLADALEYLGDSLREAGSADEALSAYRESFEVGMSPERAPKWSPHSVLGEEAALLASLADHEGCVLVRQRLVEFSREDGDRRNLAIDLEHLGRALRDAGQPDQAIAMYQESYQVGMNPEPVQNWNPGVSLRFQAELMSDRGEKVEALRLRHDIVAIARARQNRHELTIALEYLGDALWKCGHLEDAAVAFAESFQCGMHPDRLPDWNPRIPTRKEADVRLELGDRAAADELRRRAVESLRTDVEHYRALGDRKNLADALEYLGDSLREAGSADEALSAYRESFEVGMSPERAPEWSPRWVLGNEASLLTSLADHDGCVLVRHRLVEFSREDGDRRYLAIDLEHLGHALRDAGQPDQAIAMYQESHQIGMNPEPIQNWNPGVSLRYQAILLAERGEEAEALRLCHELVAIARARQNRQELAIALEYLGDDLREAGSAEEALRAYRESFEVGMSPERAPEWSPRSVLAEEARLLSSLGDYVGGVAVWRRVVEFARQDGDRRELAIDLEALADALRQAGQSDEAMHAYLEAFDVGTTPPVRIGGDAARPLLEVGLMLGMSGDADGSLQFLRRAVEIARGGGSSANAPLGSVVLLRASRALGAILSSAGMVIAAVEEMDPDSQIALAVARGREGSHELLSAAADWWGTQAECLEGIGDRHEAESARRRERRIRGRLTEPR